MNAYLWWPATLVLLCIGSATCAYNNGVRGGIWWFLGTILFSVGFGTLYATFTKYTTNLVLDNLLYSVIITITVTGSFIWFGCGKSFGILQWMGLCLIVIGLIIFKLK